VNLNHFRLLRVVGKGAFGKVRIVERKDSGLTFALKYIRKDEGQPDSAYPTVKNPLTKAYSGAVRERAQHHPRAADAGTSQPSISLQSSVQLPRC
jgi:serine/threonine protein kinase